MDAKAMRLRRESLELPLLISLVELGGSVIPDEDLYHLVAEKAGISEDAEYDIVHARPKWVYDLQWVRHTLVKHGEIDGSIHGMWQITERGRERVEREWDTYRGGVTTRARPTGPRSFPIESPAPSLEKQAREWIEDYYRKRMDTLRAVALVDVLPLMNPYALLLECVYSAHDIVEGALRAYLALAEESVFGVPYVGHRPRPEDWQELSERPDYAVHMIQFVDRERRRYLPDYYDEWAKALNRLSYQLIVRFAKRSGRINWEKIVRLNSGVDGGKD